MAILERTTALGEMMDLAIGLLSAYALVWVSFVAHECGHLYAYARNGIRASEIVIGEGPGIRFHTSAGTLIRIGSLASGRVAPHPGDRDRLNNLSFQGHMDRFASGPLFHLAFGLLATAVSGWLVGASPALWATAAGAGLVVATLTVVRAYAWLVYAFMITTFLALVVAAGGYVVLAMKAVGLAGSSVPGAYVKPISGYVIQMVSSVPGALFGASVLTVLVAILHFLPLLQGDGGHIAEAYLAFHEHGRISKWFGWLFRRPPWLLISFYGIAFTSIAIIAIKAM